LLVTGEGDYEDGNEPVDAQPKKKADFRRPSLHLDTAAKAAGIEVSLT